MAEEQLEQLGVIFQPGWDPVLPPPPFPVRGNNSNLHTKEPGELEQLWQREFHCEATQGWVWGWGETAEVDFWEKMQHRFNSSLVPLWAGTGGCLIL